MIDTRTQRHVLPMAAPAAILRGVGGTDLDELSASFFRFAGQLREKGRPRCIMNAFCQTMVMGHTVDMQVFHRYQAKAVNNLTTFLMSEIVTPELNSFMHTGYHFTMLLPLSASE